MQALFQLHPLDFHVDRLVTYGVVVGGVGVGNGADSAEVFSGESRPEAQFPWWPGELLQGSCYLG